MSVAETTPLPAADPLVAAPGSRRMRRAQFFAVARQELTRLLLRRRALGAMVLAALPVLLMAAWAFAGRLLSNVGVADVAIVYAQIYRGFILQMIVIFGCVVIFSNLIRREVRDRTLHYHLLSPVRRDVLLVGKYTGGLIAAAVIFGTATVLSFLLTYAPFLSLDPVGVQRFFSDGPGLAHLLRYLTVTVFSCLGFGAVFLALGLWFKNPVLPAIFVYGWELGNFLMPPALKKLSVIHYLVNLLPVPVDQGPFAILSTAPSPWFGIPGLIVLSIVLLGFSIWRVGGMEINYGED
jgi:ABC-type transport system involved in multi-copper enzyme maturation permease subunit